MVAPEAEFEFSAVYPDKPILSGVYEAPPVEIRAAHECTTPDGLFVRIKGYGDCAEAIEAAGSSRCRRRPPRRTDEHAVENTVNRRPRDALTGHPGTPKRLRCCFHARLSHKGA